MHYSRVDIVGCLSLLLISHYWLGSVEACNNGYGLVIHSIENCAGEGQIITIDPKMSVTLTKDCGVQAKGTIRTLGFNSAQMKITITKNGIPVVNDSTDICAGLEDAASNQDAAALIKMFGIPDQCPVAATEIVNDGSKTYSLESYKHNLLVAQGRSIVDVQIKHDKGESCFKIDMEVTGTSVVG